MASKSMYYASVLIDGEEYYIGHSQYDELCLYSNTFAMGCNQQIEFAQSTVQLIELQGRASIFNLPEISSGKIVLINLDIIFSVFQNK